MKKIITLSLIIFAMACGNKQGSSDKATELANLKKQQEEIADKIRKIESSMGNKKDSTKIKVVQIVPVTASLFSHYIESQGNVEAKDNVWVGTKLPGTTIINVYVHEGQNVSAGQVMADGETSALNNQIAGMQTQLELAKTNYQKLTNLWEQKIGTEIQLLQAKAGKESLEKQIAALEAQKSMAKIIAPFSGVVDEVKIKPGEMISMVSPGIRVVNTSGMKIKCKLADTYINKVRVGNKVIVKIPESNQEIAANINFVSSVVDPISRTFNIEAAIHSNLLKPNMVAPLMINDLTVANSIVINENLIQSSEKGDFVVIAVHKNDKIYAHKAFVVRGDSYNGNIIIKEGLKVGDELLTGFTDLEENEEVKL